MVLSLPEDQITKWSKNNGLNPVQWKDVYISETVYSLINLFPKTRKQITVCWFPTLKAQARLMYTIWKDETTQGEHNKTTG